MQKYAPRFVVSGLALAALLVVWFPLASSSDLRESQIDVANGDLSSALSEAEAAADAQPYAASPQLQKAIVLEIQGEDEAAVEAAREATRKESANWRNWITLSRLEAKTGDAEASVSALREARKLNPRLLGGSA